MTSPKRCKRVGIKNCDYCVAGECKKPARRKQRRDGKKQLRRGDDE